MFRNMAVSLIRSVQEGGNSDIPDAPKVAGRIVTTVPKAKELRPIVEKLVTMAKRALVHQRNAAKHATSAKKGSQDWINWRQSPQWNEWNQAIAPAVALRRRAFAELRDHVALNVLFGELAERYEHRDGGYLRILKLATVRLGDAGKQALIEFVGEDDRRWNKRRAKSEAPVVVAQTNSAETTTTEETTTSEVSSHTATEASETEKPAT